MVAYSLEQQSSERLIRLIIRAAANDSDAIRVEYIVFTVSYMAYHMPPGYYYYHEDAFVHDLEIASDLTPGGPDFRHHFKHLTELLCNFVPSMDKRKVDFLSRVLQNWHLCLTAFSAAQRQKLLRSIATQLFAKCRRFIVTAPSFSLQLKMLEILHMYFGSAMIGFLRTNELPPDGLAYLDFRGSIDSFVYKQEYLTSINMSRRNNDLILSLPLKSVKYGPILKLSHSVNRFWLHWNQRVGTFEIWMCGMKVTINYDQLILLKMKRKGPSFDFTLNRPPEFENRFGKSIRPEIKFHFLEVSFDKTLRYKWRFLLQDTFADRFRFVPLKRSAPEPENDDDDYSPERKTKRQRQPDNLPSNPK